MKKLVFTIIFALCAFLSFSQTATKAMQVSQNNTLIAIDKGVDTLNQSLRLNYQDLDSINLPNRIITYTTSFTTASGTHTWVSGDAITSSTAASIANTISIPNGIYEIIEVFDCFYSESNSFLHGVLFWTDTLYQPANSGQYALGTWRIPSLQEFYTCTHITAPFSNTWYYEGFKNFGANGALQSYSNQNMKGFLRVVNGYIAYTLISYSTLANSTPRQYFLRLRLRPIKKS